MSFIDFRSDTVTLPCKKMLNAMSIAEVGDDVYGEDPTVNALQEKISDLTGKEAALFTPSGTSANLLALITHCRRGDEYLVGQTAHTYMWEGGGAAALGGIQPQPIECDADGCIPFEKAEFFVKPIEDYFPRTRLFCIENTTNGKALPLSYLKKIMK